MKEEYDFSHAIKNPHVDKLKKQITIRLDDDIIVYFKKIAEETGMPYQNLINLYLKDCVQKQKQLKINFA